MGLIFSSSSAAKTTLKIQFLPRTIRENNINDKWVLIKNSSYLTLNLSAPNFPIFALKCSTQNNVLCSGDPLKRLRFENFSYWSDYFGGGSDNASSLFFFEGVTREC